MSSREAISQNISEERNVKRLSFNTMENRRKNLRHVRGW
jgi:hypothetical protein